MLSPLVPVEPVVERADSGVDSGAAGVVRVAAVLVLVSANAVRPVTACTATKISTAAPMAAAILAATLTNRDTVPRSSLAAASRAAANPLQRRRWRRRSILANSGQSRQIEQNSRTVTCRALGPDTTKRRRGLPVAKRATPVPPRVNSRSRRPGPGSDFIQLAIFNSSSSRRRRDAVSANPPITNSARPPSSAPASPEPVAGVVTPRTP